MHVIVRYTPQGSAGVRIALYEGLAVIVDVLGPFEDAAAAADWTSRHDDERCDYSMHELTPPPA